MVNKFSDLEITNSPAGKSSPAQTSVERAIGDLRRGALVILRDAPNQTAAVVQAAEMATSMGLKMLAQITGSHPTLAITRNRAASINIFNQSSNVLSVSLPQSGDPTFIHRLSDPTFLEDPDNNDFKALEIEKLTVIPESSGGIAEKAIQLAKYARLLPSTVFSRLPLA
ncbi:MAG: hypothetical protein CMM17_02090, partial [Rhodospirillaceae bacterium]|nr:hypothetical protein [Rhodospirillaceae bacterium]